MRVLVVDNYDSFTYNLVQYLGELGAEIEVVRNDRASVDELMIRGYDRVIVSPGPCTPDQAGISLEAVRRFPEAGIPTLGVCLGHQALVQAFGGRVVVGEPVHGKTAVIDHDGRSIFRNLKRPLEVGRYHSLIVGSRDSAVARAKRLRRGCGDGRSPPRAPRRGGPVPPRIGAHRAGPRAAFELPAGDEMTVSLAPATSEEDLITRSIDLLCAGQDLDQETAAAVLAEIMVGNASEVQIAAFLIALRAKGETVRGARRARGDDARPRHARPRAGATTCSTPRAPGGGRRTFNVSTTAALIAAGAGCTVAKHGNRSATGLSGSADLLEALGARIDLTPDAVARCIEDVAFGFMFAPSHHQATRYVVPVRRQLGVRTIFNLLGPLTNPAGATRQVIGVADPSYLETIAGALARLGTDHALVVTSDDGLDELSISAPTTVVEVHGGGLERYTLSPEDVGLERAAPEEVPGGDPAANAATARRIFAGEPGGPRDLAVLNAGAAIYAADRAPSLREGVRAAREAIDSGAVASLLERFVARTRELA